jgi:hypothetical protein
METSRGSIGDAGKISKMTLTILRYLCLFSDFRDYAAACLLGGSALSGTG